MISMNNKAPHPFSSSNNDHQTTDDSPEESSWTFYMQDFLCGKNDDEDDVDDVVSLSSGSDHQEIITDHAVSDAFSSAGSKVCDNNTASAAAFTSTRSNGKQLSFKRRKPNVGASVNDHDLEDTASSPANSPKMSNTNHQPSFNQNEKDNIQLLKRSNVRNNTTEEVVGADNEVYENSNESELKKRGLRLVPVSMLRDYFG